MKQIGIALQGYHDDFRSFPPAFIADSEGKPIHSWRILVLPYFESEELKEIYTQYDFDQPWNGPKNRKLLDKAPELFRCPQDTSDQSETSYLAVVGPPTIWPGAGATRLRDVSDGMSRTIAIVECSNSGIPWLEPRDAGFEDVALGVNQLQTRAAIRSRHSAGGANAVWGDTHVEFLTESSPAAVIRALLTIDGGEPLQFGEIDGDYHWSISADPP